MPQMFGRVFAFCERPLSIMGLRNWIFFDNDGLKTSKTGGVKIAVEKSLKLANLSVFLRFCDFLLVLAIFQPLENASKAREKLIIIETIETTNTLQGLIVHTKEEDEFFLVLPSSSLTRSQSCSRLCGGKKTRSTSKTKKMFSKCLVPLLSLTLVAIGKIKIVFHRIVKNTVSTKCQ